MIFEGDTSVIDAIKEKKRLMDAGEEHGHIKPLLVIDGGLMKGAYSVGACMALEELGYRKVFENVVGISSGAPTASYFISGQVFTGAPILWERCCRKEFINLWRFWNQVDTEYFMEAMKEEGEHGLDVNAVIHNSTKPYFGVANFETGEPKLIQPKTKEELFSSIHASILMPNVSNDIVHLDSIRYADGGFTKPHVLMRVFEEIEATHLLMITNQDHIDKVVPDLPFMERLLNHTIFRWRMPKLLRFAAHERWRERLAAIEYMKESVAIEYALVWGDRSIKSMERDAEKVKQVVEASRQWWLNLLTD